MDSPRSPHDPSDYLESLMQAGQQSFSSSMTPWPPPWAWATSRRSGRPRLSSPPQACSVTPSCSSGDSGNATLVKALGVESQVMPGKGDRRFKDEAWAQTPYYDLLKQSYLFGAKQLTDFVDQAQGRREDQACSSNFTRGSSSMR